MNSYNITKKTETNTAIISLCDDGIMRVVFKKGAEITPHEVESNFFAYNTIVKGESYPFLISAEDSTVIYTDEARRYAKKHENDYPKICIAFLVRSLAHKLTVTFYLKFDNPQHPTAVFKDVDEAEAWCIEQYWDYQHHQNELDLVPIPK